MNIHLTPQLETMVRERVASGHYASVSEVIREALRRMELQETQERAGKAVAYGELAAFMRGVAAQNRDQDPVEMERLIAEAVNEARGQASAPEPQPH
jgi:antitoxin ParD1/3/4